MGLRAQLEAIIYAAETPITVEHMVQLVKESAIAEGAADDAEVKSRVRAVLEALVADYGGPDHGIEIRQVAGGYRMSTKPEQHEMVRLQAIQVRQDQMFGEIAVRKHVGFDAIMSEQAAVRDDWR